MRKDWFSKLLLLCAFILFFGAAVAVILTRENDFGAEFMRISEELSNVLPLNL